MDAEYVFDVSIFMFEVSVTIVKIRITLFWCLWWQVTVIEVKYNSELVSTQISRLCFR